jgi:hypothetical protein
MVTTPGTNPISDRLTQRHLPSDEAASGMAFAYPDCPSANTNAVPHDVTGRDKGRCGIELSPLCAECGRLLLSSTSLFAQCCPLLQPNATKLQIRCIGNALSTHNITSAVR